LLQRDALVGQHALHEAPVHVRTGVPQARDPQAEARGGDGEVGVAADLVRAA
jgi:hypothetical protein